MGATKHARGDLPISLACYIAVMTYRGTDMRRRQLIAAAIVFAVPADAQAGPVVFAAASLTDALREVDRLWVARGNPALRLNFGASSTLARQMEEGAEPDVFISADERWMDRAAERNLIVPATRVSPIGNSLVLIAPADSTLRTALDRGTDLLALLGPGGRLATGDPAHVPVGRYARAALTWMGQWEALAPRLARAGNVRSALLLVERGEAPLGIVYATDAAISPAVRVVGTFPAASHPPIRYPFAVGARRDTPQARALLAFLTGPEAMEVYERLGFTRP